MLSIDENLYDLTQQTAKNVGLDADAIIAGFAKIVEALAPLNEALLKKRDELQAQIDAWFADPAHAGNHFSSKDYVKFLTEIGYIVKESDDFQVATRNVDPEFTTPGPQLVCPAFIKDDPEINARYPLNAVNARWGSLYDAAYGKPGDNNVIGEEGEKGFTKGYNPARGEAIIAYVNDFLDRAVPLAGGARHGEVTGYGMENKTLIATLDNGQKVALKNPECFAGFDETNGSLSSLMLKHHGLHIELQIDRRSRIGGQNKSGLNNVLLESALTTIIDLEDSAAAVDAADKVRAYTNVIGIIKGDLTAKLEDKGGIRKLEPDKSYKTPDGHERTLSGRSTMLFRKTGMQMHTDAVTLEGRQIPEGFLDTLMIALASMQDLQKGEGELKNSKAGSIYIVMPKMHGPEEVALNVKLCDEIETLLGLKPNTIKIGIMDEEQRTSVNLKECIRAARERIVFINTGFLDRTGDLIHTSMEAGALDTKSGMKDAPWLDAYERSNMQVGLATGLNKVGQIGKGMWAQNRNPKGLVETKGAHPKSGATTAWAPDPKNALLHAMHYHETDVNAVQQELIAKGNKPVEKAHILDIPFLKREIPKAEKTDLLYGYMQSILGYVTPWVNQGVGCSSVPDHTGTALMEDRATLRIGSQLIANWLKHNVVTEADLKIAAERAAAKVDEQNKLNPDYTPLVGNYDGPAFQAAMRLVYEGAGLPNGYVEPPLHSARLEVKAHGARRGGGEVRYIPPANLNSPTLGGSRNPDGTRLAVAGV